MSQPETPRNPLDLPIFRLLDAESAAQPETRPEGRVGMHALAGRIDSSARSAPGAPPAVAAVEGAPPPLTTQLGLPADFTGKSAPRNSTHVGSRRGGHVGSSIDWKQIALFRSQASDRLSAATTDERGRDPEMDKELGRSIIQELLQAEAAERLSNGDVPWTLGEQDEIAQAVFNALFALGRLQPLLDDDTVENIIIAGALNVWLEKTDGSLVRAAPVADSDEELLDFLSFIASRSEVNARPFDSTNPRLHMRLDGGARLAAAAWVTAYPCVVIRRHRLRKVTLEDLTERNMITPLQASFLRAAVQARKSIVVSGPQGAGKTTLMRALCGAINPWEILGTFETEYELHLHELTASHPIVTPFEARPGSGEVGADGRQAGAFTLPEALYDSFRFNLSRQIVGEVRGHEVWAMIKAMESGAGSLSTTHGKNAEAALRKLVTCAMEAGSHITNELATSKLAETIDLIVQVHLETVPLGDNEWRKSRWVSEIIAVAPGESAKGYALTHVFKPNPHGGPAVPGVMPDELQDLEAYGFDLGLYLDALNSSEERTPWSP